ncbi:SH3 domain-containing protein [Pelotalea chapellei]|uniref:SH3 domain-containing protein n=1 Tax=Pelotalea chapellei TaxID=44671 RepID=A0ABS5U613_9BACT|nr:SH3 domain-containing protein [Pelotalea chapellei]MBT1071110.1 SH3 domain-containing protein [Pelotalea chapellei]
MTTGFSSRTHLLLLACSILMISACTLNKGTMTSQADQMAGSAIEAGKSEAQSALVNEVQAVAQPKVVEPARAVAEEAPEVVQPPKAAVTRINSTERLVNIRTSPSAKARKVAVLKSGHSLEVLDVKDDWVKVQWLKGKTVKQGWVKKSFVEGYGLQN